MWFFGIMGVGGAQWGECVHVVQEIVSTGTSYAWCIWPFCGLHFQFQLQGETYIPYIQTCLPFVGYETIHTLLSGVLLFSDLFLLFHDSFLFFREFGAQYYTSATIIKHSCFCRFHYGDRRASLHLKKAFVFGITMWFASRCFSLILLYGNI